MCGIAGVLAPRGSYDDTVPARMIAPLRHRGPDACGVEVLSEVALCAARLAIVDLSPEANQPFWDGEHRCAVVFNGEIYNYKELREELRTSGAIFHTSSDTEVVVEAYKRWGLDFQHRLNGMWGLAIWDATQKTLILSRDRFGVKPLFVRRDREALHFASEMKGILAAGFDAEINPDAVTAVHEWSGADRETLTLFRGIEALPAGHCLIVKPGSAPETRCWWKTLEQRTDVPRRRSDRVDRFRELLIDSVRIRLRTDVPNAISLSGGLDSASVFASYHHLRRQGMADRATLPGAATLIPFVVRYDGEAADESERARRIARHFGDEIRFVHVGPSAFAEDVRDVLWHQEAIPWNAGVLAYHALYKAIAAAGARVVLEGHGSDEMLAGYPQIAQAAMRHAVRHFRLPSAARYARAVASAQNPAGDRVETRALLHLARAWRPGVAMPLRDAIDDAFQYRVLPTILRIFDRASMAASVESRAPFLDYRLVSFTLSLPDSDVIRSGRTKWIERQAMRDFLPPDVVWQKGKLGFAVPQRSWFGRSEVTAAIREALENGAMAAAGTIDVRDCRARFDHAVKHGFTEASATRIWQEYAQAIVAGVFRERLKALRESSPATAPA
jgi:asparagine synthase (glutamine-hydrolysing)